MNVFSTTRVCAAVTAILFSVGCSTTRSGGPVATAALIRHLRDATPELDVELDPGSSPSTSQPIRPLGRLVDLDDTTVTVWFRGAPVPAAGQQNILVSPLAQVRRIRSTSGATGALEGALVGALAAIVVGVVIAARAKDNCGPADNPDEICFTPLGSGVLAATLLGFPAAALGALVGRAVGHRTDTVFGADPP